MDGTPEWMVYGRHLKDSESMGEKISSDETEIKVFWQNSRRYV